MRAIRFEGAGGPEVIKLVEEAQPTLRPHDLLVRVKAAGINRADIIQRQGYYGENPDFGDSLLPGLEIAGEVVETGPAVMGFRPGDRVMAIVGGGGYAEYARVDYRMAMCVPSRLTYPEAAAVPEVFVTAHEALLHLGELAPGGWALIHAAAGGVGSAAVQLAHALGARSVFTASGQDRIQRVHEVGGTVGVDYKNQDFLAVALEATGGRGVDVVVDFIGGSYLDRNLRALVPGGRLVQVGLLDGEDARLPFGLIIHNHLRIIGTVMKSRSFEDKQAMTTRFRDRWLESFAQGQLVPLVARTFPLGQAAEAHLSMEASGNVGKVVLTID
ncbi:NAD(P)H-quinone oxidoreductase [Edaphobacter aggregans]|uniref:NAD(P)H-quinone oxidoreductase n=1 Tax=Edaphobacter aggregans TaxID=570835 RepID=UPI00054DD416|nr:NAD(P)H-quinone oxidoreductase [Edaphobacter aggregans]